MDHPISMSTASRGKHTMELSRPGYTIHAVATKLVNYAEGGKAYFDEGDCTGDPYEKGCGAVEWPHDID